MKKWHSIVRTVQIIVGICFVVAVTVVTIMLLQTQKVTNANQAVLGAETTANNLKSLGFQVPVTFESPMTVNSDLSLSGTIHLQQNAIDIGGKTYTFPDTSNLLSVDEVNRLIQKQVANIQPTAVTQVTNNTTSASTDSLAINTTGALQGGGSVQSGGSLTLSCPTCLTLSSTLFSASASAGNTSIISQGGTLSILGGSNIATTGNGSGALTISTVVTPNFTTINGLTIPNNGNNTLAIATGKTLAVNNSLIFSGTDSTSFTLPVLSDTLVGRTSADVLTNKTIAAGLNTISGLSNVNLSGSAGISNANLANSSITVTTSGLLSGGGNVALGGGLTLSCPTCLASGSSLFTILASTGSASTIFQGNTLNILGGSNIATTNSGNGTITIATSQNPTFTSVNGLTLGSVIQPITAGGLTLLVNGDNNITLGQNSGVGNVVIQPNAGGQAALIVNKQGIGDLFTASASGTTKFVISQNGYVGIGTNNATSPLTIVAPTSGVVPIMNFMTPTNLWTDTQYISFTNARALFGYDGPNASAFVQSTSDKGLELQTNGANTRLYISSIGNVGIGTMNPGATQLTVNQLVNGDVFDASFSGTPLFRIDRNGNTRITASLCVKGSMTTNCSGSTVGSIYATSTSITSADYAENYISSQNLEPGDLVIPSNDGNSQAIVKSTNTYQQQLLGVVSTSPGITLNSDAATDTLHPNKYPIALSGRVPVKVSTENGSIHSGDFLTTSSQTGIAMKATQSGVVIGKALEDYSQSGTGKIMVFVSVGYNNPNNSGLGEIVPTSQVAQQVDSSLIKNLTISGALTSSGSAEFKQKTIFDDIVEFFAKVIFHSDVDLLGKTYIANPVFGKDAAGVAVIPVASDEAHIVFNTPYETKPVVNITLSVSSSDASNSAEQAILNGDLRYVLENEDVSGFTIKINKPAPDDVSINWTALNNQ